MGIRNELRAKWASFHRSLFAESWSTRHKHGDFNIIVCPFEGDRKNKVAERLARVLCAKPRLKAHINKRLPVLPLATSGVPFIKVRERARELAHIYGADLVVFGTVIKNNVHIHAISVNRLGLSAPGFDYPDRLVMPLPKIGSADIILHGFALCAINPDNRYGIDLRKRLLQNISHQIEHLCNIGSIFPRKYLADGYYIKAGIVMTLGELTNSLNRKQRALTLYGQAMRHTTEQFSPLLWAGAQRRMGSILMGLNVEDRVCEPQEREGLTRHEAHYAEALYCLRQAIDVVCAQTNPNEKARMRLMLGRALSKLSSHGQSVAVLNATENTLKPAMRTWQHRPDRQADAKEVLASVYHDYGRHNEDVKIVEKSVQLFREVLDVRGNQNNMTNMAYGSNNLAAALMTLSRMTTNINLLRECKTLTLRAISLYRQLGHNNEAGIAKSNLQHIKISLRYHTFEGIGYTSPAQSRPVQAVHKGLLDAV